MTSCRDLLCLVQRGAGLLFTVGAAGRVVTAMSATRYDMATVDYLMGYVLPAVAQTVIGLVLLLSARRLSSWFYPDGGKNGNPKVIAKIDERTLYRLGCRLLGVFCVFVAVLPGHPYTGLLLGYIDGYWNDDVVSTVGLVGAALLILPGSAWRQSCRNRSQRLFTWWRSWPKLCRSFTKWCRFIIAQEPLIPADDTAPTNERDVTMGSEDETS